MNFWTLRNYMQVENTQHLNNYVYASDPTGLKLELKSNIILVNQDYPLCGIGYPETN